MSERLRETLPSGLYRSRHPEAIVDAARARGLFVARVALGRGADKAQLLAKLAAALQFPDWFGHNWDALEECLTDLDWIAAPGVCMVVEGTHWLDARELDAFCEVLTHVAAAWTGERRAFYAVLIPGRGPLPDLDAAAGQ